MQNCYCSTIPFDEALRDIHRQTFDRDAYDLNEPNLFEDLPPGIKQQYAFFDYAQLYEVLVVFLQYLVRQNVAKRDD